MGKPLCIDGLYRPPLAIELFAGLHGWAEGFLAEGYRVVGFDIVDMCKEIGHPRPEGDLQLVLQDVLTLHGSQFKDAAVIVASPPCQAYSYRAMPWKRAKALPPPSNELFEACFRIQREASVAACGVCGGTGILGAIPNRSDCFCIDNPAVPLIVENVKGAQPWVGRAHWHYGSFYLWGDVPALMPSARMLKVPGFNSHQHENGKPGGSFQSAAVKNASAQRGGSWFGVAHGKKQQPDHPARGDAEPGVKQHGSGAIWFDTGIAHLPSSSGRRKAASAQIAKIPLPLSTWIAKTYKPNSEAVA